MNSDNCRLVLARQEFLSDFGGGLLLLGELGGGLLLLGNGLSGWLVPFSLPPVRHAASLSYGPEMSKD